MKIFIFIGFSRYAVEGDSDSTGDVRLESMKEHLFEKIKDTFKVSQDQAAQLYSELLQCTRKKHLVSYF